MAVVKYVCPVHKKKVLYEEEDDDKVLKAVIFDEPKLCELCDIDYYKADCDVLPE